MGRTHRSSAADADTTTAVAEPPRADDARRDDEIADAYGVDLVAEPAGDTPTLDLARTLGPTTPPPSVTWAEALDDGDYAGAVARIGEERAPEPAPSEEGRSLAEPYGVDPSTWEGDDLRAEEAPSPARTAPPDPTLELLDRWDRRDAADAEYERLGNRDADEAWGDLSPEDRADVAAFDPSRAGEHGRGALEVEDDGVTARVGSVEAPRDGASGVDASVGADGELGLRRRSRAGDATTTTSVTANPLDGEVGVGVSRRTGSGDSATTVGATASADVGLDGITGATVGASASYPGGKKITTSWGYDVDIAQPVYDAGRWRIDGTLTWTGSVGASHDDGTDTVSGSVHVGQTRRFVRYFPAQPNAQAWYDAATDYFGVASWTEFGEVEPGEMAIGDRSETTTELGADVGLSGDVGVVEVGMTFGYDDRSMLRVTRSDASHVRLRVESRHVGELGATAAAGEVGLGESVRFGDYEGREVEFDLEGPGGAALRRAMDSGTLPSGEEGEGWRLIETSDGEVSGGTETVNLGVAELRYVEEVEDGYVVRRDTATGERVRLHRVGATGSMAAETPLPDWLVEDTALDGASTSTRFTSIEGAGATIEGSVHGSDAADTHAELARATGAHTHLDGVSGAASGTWNVRETLSEADMSAFLHGLADGSAREHAHLFGTQAGAVDSLAAEVRGSDTPEAARSAVGRFFAAYRERAMTLVRAMLGGDAGPVDVSLAGSDVFEGAAGRDRVAARLTELESRATRSGADLAAISSELRQLREDQRRRLDAMRDAERFRDLPPELREREIALNEPLLARCDEALAEVRSHGDADRGEADEDFADTELAADLDPAGARLLGDNSRDLLASLAGDERRMLEARGPFLHAREVAERERGIHRGDAGAHFSTPAAEGLTLAWDPFGVAENAAYATADGAYARGNAAAERARTEYAAFQSERDTAPSGGLLDHDESARVQSLRQHAWRAHDAYVEGATAFVEAVDTWRGIRERHPGREYWGESAAPEDLGAPPT